MYSLNEVARMKIPALITLLVMSFLFSVHGQTATNDFFTSAAGAVLNVAAPGVLANDGGANLVAALVTGPVNGTLTLKTNGAFVYTPTNSFSGMDGFTYRVSSGTQTSGVASVVIMVRPPGELFYDNFARPTNGGPILPWIQVTTTNVLHTGNQGSVGVLGVWNVSNLTMNATSPPNCYGYDYYPNAGWSNYMVQAQIQFSSSSAASAGILGRLNPVTGAHYGLWVYPENSTEQYSPHNGTAVMLLIKYSNWTLYTVVSSTVTLPGIGTNWHALKLGFQANTISCYFDNLLLTSITDNGSLDGTPAYTNGGVGFNMWTIPGYPYTFAVDNVIVSTNGSIANSDAYTAVVNSLLQVPAPGILANDIGNGNLTALLVQSPTNGNLTLTSTGGFSYTPTNGFIGLDSFTYKCTDGQTTSGVATVFITVSNLPPLPPTANNDLFNMTANTTLTVGPPGVLANDVGGQGALTTVLAGSTANGSLTLTNTGGFSYTPTTNFLGFDAFNYLVTDGHGTSSVATAEIMVKPSGALFFDNFKRPTNNSSIFPWVNELGTWSITNNILFGSCGFNNYGYVYFGANWTDFSVQAKVRCTSTNAWGGALAGRLNPATGARYDVWIYPENSPWPPQNGLSAGQARMQLIKYSGWTGYTAQNLISIPAMGTNWHDLKLAFLSTNVFAYYDGNKITNLVDNGAFNGQPAFTNGGIGISIYGTTPTIFPFSVSNVLVSLLVFNDGFSTPENTALTIAKPGVLTNDLDVYGTNLTATLLAGPTNGTLSLSTNGSFTYTPATNYFGNDGFTIQAKDKLNVLGVATTSITVLPATNVLTVTVNNTNRFYGATNPVFTVSYSGFLNGDTTNMLSGAPVFSTLATTSSPAGNYPITASVGTLTATNNKYLFNFTAGNLTVVQVPTPVILSVGLTNQIITVAWSSVATAAYGLQYTTNLTSGIWTTLSQGVTATGARSSQTNFVGGTPQEFYRITSLPAGP